MSLVRRDNFTLDWPERWRRLLDFDSDLGGWLRVEEFRDGEDLIVRVEIPGVDPDRDVRVSVSDGMLHVEGERREHSDHKEKHAYRSEFRYGAFVRDVALPPGVTEADVKATYGDGILEVRLPFPPERKPEVMKVPVVRR